MSTSRQTVLIAIASLIVGVALGQIATNAHQSFSPRTMHQMKGSSMGQSTMMDHSRMGMNEMMTSMTKNLQGKRDADFDKAFIAEMIPHHQGAVEMAQLVLTSTQRPELQQMAHDIITAQTKEITMMQDWQKEWFDTAK